VDLYQISVGRVPNIFIFMIFRKDIMIIFVVNPLPSSFIHGEERAMSMVALVFNRGPLPLVSLLASPDW
jgi:hypothetical protein